MRAIRDPIKAFEYMNRYYVLEGNTEGQMYSSTSTPFRFLQSSTRKIPKLSDDYDVRLYYGCI